MAEDQKLDWRPADPGRTHAVVIGIEAYEAGPEWDLDGPVRDASRFFEWLTASEVPATQIDVMLSPLDRNRTEPAAFPTATKGGDRAEVQQTFLRGLPSRTGDLLWVYWSGHGLVDSGHRRRLFYADATERDPRGIDADSLMIAMASDLLSSFARQIWIFDACQSFIGPAAHALPSDTLPGGRPRRDVDQDVLFAARPGQSAANLTDERAGLFTRELLRELGAPAARPWPPDPAEVTRALRVRFAELRGTGHMTQTPAYFWHRSRSGEAGQVMHLPSDRPAQPAARPGRYPTSMLAELVDALMEVDEFADHDSRQELMRMIRAEIAGAVPWQSSDRLTAFAVVRTCLRFPGGLTELVETVRVIAGSTTAMSRIDAAASALLR